MAVYDFCFRDRDDYLGCKMEPHKFEDEDDAKAIFASYAEYYQPQDLIYVKAVWPETGEFKMLDWSKEFQAACDEHDDATIN